jgi:glutamate-1-semialdehyde 2,1-aminomutase
LTCLDHDLQPSPSHRTLCLQQLLHAGVFMPWVCPSFRHGAREIDQTLEAFDRVCAVYARAIERRSVEGLLTGRPVKPVF